MNTEGPPEAVSYGIGGVRGTPMAADLISENSTARQNIRTVCGGAGRAASCIAVDFVFDIFDGVWL